MLRDGAHTIYLTILVRKHANWPTGKFFLLDRSSKDLAVEAYRSV